MSVIIGMDPHKRSATIEVVDEQAVVLAAGRFALIRPATPGCSPRAGSSRTGRGRPGAATASVGISRTALFMTARLWWTCRRELSAQIRVFATGNGRAQDRPGLALISVALAALRSLGLVRVQADDDLVVMGMRPHAGREPAAPPAAGAVSRRHEAVPVSAAGPGDDRHDPAPGPAGQDPPPPRRRAHQRA